MNSKTKPGTISQILGNVCALPSQVYDCMHWIEYSGGLSFFILKGSFFLPNSPTPVETNQAIDTPCIFQLNGGAAEVENLRKIYDQGKLCCECAPFSPNR